MRLSSTSCVSTLLLNETILMCLANEMIHAYTRMHIRTYMKAYITLFLLKSRGYRTIKYSLHLNIGYSTVTCPLTVALI